MTGTPPDTTHQPAIAHAASDAPTKTFADQISERDHEVPDWASLTADSPLVHNVHPSGNIGLRKAGGVPKFLILHYTGFADGPSAIDWLANPASGVSCHYVVDVDGTITQMVAERHRAWHAGLSFWAGETDINSFSIGIEIQNPGHGRPGGLIWPAAQMAAVRALSADITARHRIAPGDVLAHSDIAPRRKIDPGETFPWCEFADAGLAQWVAPQPVPDLADRRAALANGDLAMSLGEIKERNEQDTSRLATLQHQLAAIGYDCPTTAVCCPATVAAIAAFQRRHRPALVDGLADDSTLATAERLLATVA